MHVDSPEEALERDARLIASRVGMSEEKMLAILQLQEAAPAVLAEVRTALGDSFSGSWIEHEPEPALVVYTTLAEVSQDFSTSSVPVRVVPGMAYSWDELVHAANLVAGSEFARLTGISTSVDEPTNGLIVGIHADSELAVEVSQDRSRQLIARDPAGRIVATLPLDVAVRVEITAAQETPHASIRGGVRTTLGSGADTGNCTTGFSVRNAATGALRILTAGHCPNSPGLYRELFTTTSYAMQFVNESMAANGRDFQWHRVDGHTPVNEVYLGSQGFRTITATRAQEDQSGHFVCHRGHTTDYSCGVVASIAHAPGGTASTSYPSVVCGGVGACEAKWVRIVDYCGAGGCTGLESDGGDSGGPYVVGGIAYGLHSGGICDGDCGSGEWAFYMGVRKISSHSFAVLAD